MEKNTIEFVAEGQVLTSATGKIYVASNTVDYIEAVFHLGDNWGGFDSVRAVWYTLDRCVASVLTVNGGVGTCIVPHEVLRRARKVVVNLVGSITDGEEVIERLTTYPITAIDVNAYARADGDNCAPITPSQFEQFVNAVREEVANIKDIDRAVLNADYTLTIRYSDGTSDTVGPIRGEQGPQGEPGPQGPPGEVDAETLMRILPTDSASGAIASFPDGSDLVPMQSLVVSIEPVQSGSGTPSPDNIRPISGWDEVEAVVCGANLLDPQTIVTGKYYNNALAEITNVDKAHSGIIRIKPSTSYCLNGFAGQSFYAMLALDANKQPITTWYGGASKTAPFVATTPSNAYYMVLNFNADQVDTIAFYESATVDGYIPYTSTAYTTTLPSTVYGGTLDMVSGVLTVDRAMVTFDGTESAWAWVTDRPIFRITDMAEGNNMSGLSDWLPTVSEFNSFGIRFGYGNNIIYLCELTANIPSITDLASFKTYLGTHNLTVCYPLATPTTITLTPQEIAVLLGTNNVWSDAGQVAVVYSADIQRYIDKKLD